MKCGMGAAVLALTLAMACGGSSANQDKAPADSQDAGASHVARIDPCALVTKDEIRKKVEASHQPDDLARLNRDGAVWTISTDSVTHGESRDCLIKWQVDGNGEMRERGDFSVSVATAEWLKTLRSDMKQPPVTIPGIGDEAFFTGGESRSPYARVGDVAIGIEGSSGQPTVDLLRAAVARVH